MHSTSGSTASKYSKSMSGTMCCLLGLGSGGTILGLNQNLFVVPHNVSGEGSDSGKKSNLS